ncbi:hypothetical protein ABBQ32_000599 [Trebouxia sp. C0010 RCD-2024]
MFDRVSRELVVSSNKYSQACGLVPIGLTSSHLDMLRTPARVVTHSSCPPAPRRQPPLRLYEGFSATDSQGHASSAESTDCTYLQTTPADTAASLRRLLQEAKAVNSVQDMLYRLRPDAPGLAHSQDPDSAGNMPLLIKARPVTVEGETSLPAYQDVWQAKRMKLFGPARGSAPTKQCVQPRYAEKLQLSQFRRCPPTAHFNPDTDHSEPATVQTEADPAHTDSVRHASDQTTSLPLRAGALALPNTSGFRYPHKVRRRHVVTGTSGRHVVSPPDALSPRDGSAAELAAAAAAPYTQARGGPPGSPALSEEGQSWQEASFPAAEAFSTPGTDLLQSSDSHFLLNGQQQLFITTFDLPQEHPPPATLRPFYAPHQSWHQGFNPL